MVSTVTDHLRRTIRCGIGTVVSVDLNHSTGIKAVVFFALREDTFLRFAPGDAFSFFSSRRNPRPCRASASRKKSSRFTFLPEVRLLGAAFLSLVITPPL